MRRRYFLRIRPSRRSRLYFNASVLSFVEAPPSTQVIRQLRTMRIFSPPFLNDRAISPLPICAMGALFKTCATRRPSFCRNCALPVHRWKLIRYPLFAAFGVLILRRIPRRLRYLNVAPFRSAFEMVGTFPFGRPLSCACAPSLFGLQITRGPLGPSRSAALGPTAGELSVNSASLPPNQPPFRDHRFRPHLTFLYCAFLTRRYILETSRIGRAKSNTSGLSNKC